MKSKTVKNLRKLTLFATAMALLGVSATAADLPEKRLNGIKRDIKVMSNIFKTTISERLGHEVGHLKGMYLAKQGMLFSMNLHQPFNFSFGEHFAPVVSTPSGLVYPVTTEEGLEAIEESTMQVVESALEMAENQLEVYSDFNWSTLSREDRDMQRSEQRELRNQQRELEREARNLERAVRDIERKIRDAEFQQELRGEKKDEKKVVQLEKELKELSASLTVITDKLQAKAESLQEKAALAQKLRKEKQDKQLKVMEQAISQAVCDFGAGLRSLPKQEFISFNISGRENRLYVFDRDSIEKCADGDITAETLLKQAVTYSL